MKKTTIWISVSILSVLMIALIGYLGIQGYRHYKIDRYNELGDAQVEIENWGLARFWYLKSIEIDADNAITLEKLARYGNYFKDPSSVDWWKQLVDIQPESNEAKFGYVEVLLHRNLTDEAKTILESIQPSEEEASKYYNLLTALYLTVKDFGSAETLTRKSIEHDPNSPALQLNLLKILLMRGAQDSAEEINTLLTQLYKSEELKPELWRVLLGYSIGRKNWLEAYKISNQLSNSPEAYWYEQVAHLKLMIKLEPEKIPEFLQQFPNPPVKMVEEMSRMLNANGFSQPLMTWLNTLLETAKNGQLSLQIAKADTSNVLQQWDALIAFTTDLDWGFLDYYRHLLRSKAYLAVGNNVESERAWLQANRLATEAGFAEKVRMAEFLESWPEFEPQWIELLHEMLKDSVHAQWAYNKLQTFYYKEGATRELFHINRIARKMFPENNSILNNYIVEGLLLGEDTSEMLKLAKGLSEEYPGKPIPTSTYAFALFKNGQKKEAYGLLKKMDPRFLDIAELAHYAAVIARGAGDEAAAQIYIEKAKNATLLPEEKGLLQIN